MMDRHATWRRLIILLATLCLTLSLATRYTTVQGYGFGSATSVSSPSVNAKAQHLLGDGAQWTAPCVLLLMLVVPRRTTRFSRIVEPVYDLYFESWLYNRPPPSL